MGIHFYFAVHFFCLPPHLTHFLALYLWATLLFFSSPILVFRMQLWPAAFWKFCCQWEGIKSEKERPGVSVLLVQNDAPSHAPYTPYTFRGLNVASALLSDGLLAQLLRRRLVEITWQVGTRRIRWDFKWEITFPNCPWWWHSCEKGGLGWHRGIHL